MVTYWGKEVCKARRARDRRTVGAQATARTGEDGGGEGGEAGDNGNASRR